MNFGLFLIESPHRAHVGPSGRHAAPGQGAALTSPEYLGGLARFAEEVGFDFVSFPEHVVLPVDYESRYPYQQYEGGDFKRYPYDETAFPEPVTALTFVAAVTERLELGTSVLILPQRNPVILAKQLATLDALSHGRTRAGGDGAAHGRRARPRVGAARRRARRDAHPLLLLRAKPRRGEARAGADRQRGDRALLAASCPRSPRTRPRDSAARYSLGTRSATATE